MGGAGLEAAWGEQMQFGHSFCSQKNYRKYRRKNFLATDVNQMHTDRASSSYLCESDFSSVAKKSSLYRLAEWIRCVIGPTALRRRGILGSFWPRTYCAFGGSHLKADWRG